MFSNGNQALFQQMAASSFELLLPRNHHPASYSCQASTSKSQSTIQPSIHLSIHPSIHLSIHIWQPKCPLGHAYLISLRRYQAGALRVPSTHGAMPPPHRPVHQPCRYPTPKLWVSYFLRVIILSQSNKFLGYLSFLFSILSSFSEILNAVSVLQTRP